MSGDSGAPTIRVLAPAKINLSLEVLGKRADGFHELETTMVALGLTDELTFRVVSRPGVKLLLDGPTASDDIPSDERNLAARAAAIVLERSGREDGLVLRLKKRIPSQSGLGGASSDAAAALAGAAIALDFEISTTERVEILGGLGSDCVFFEQAAMTGAAHCSGRGEFVVPLLAPNPAWQVALVCPDVHVSTARIFGALRAPIFVPLFEGQQRPTVSNGLTTLSAGEIQSCLRNQLEDAALDHFPKLQAWRELFDGLSESVDPRAGSESTTRYSMTGSGSRTRYSLTGSGSTFFALFQSADEAERSLGDVKRAAADRGLTMRASFLTETCGFGLRVSS